jgi:hypothetical protein
MYCFCLFCSEAIYARYAGDKNIVIVQGDHNSSRPFFLYDSIGIFLITTLQIPTEWQLEGAEKFIRRLPWGYSEAVKPLGGSSRSQQYQQQYQQSLHQHQQGTTAKPPVSPVPHQMSRKSSRIVDDKFADETDDVGDDDVGANGNGEAEEEEENTFQNADDASNCVQGNIAAKRKVKVKGKVELVNGIAVKQLVGPDSEDPGTAGDANDDGDSDGADGETGDVWVTRGSGLGGACEHLSFDELLALSLMV